MRILMIAAVAVLSAQTALAERRENKPFTTVNGRTSTAAPAGPRVFTLTTPGGGAAANGPAAAQAPAVTAGMIAGAPSDGGRAFIGGGRQTASRSATGRGVRRGGKAFWGGRKVDGDGGGTTTTSTEEAPPNYSKPGALIRTTGQLPKYEKAETATTHTTDAGEIVMNNRKAFNVGQAPSVQQGPKDTLPPPNPDTFTRTTTGTGGAAANSSGSGSSGSGGTGGGHDNNGSGNNDKDKPGDTYDPHGGDKALAASFYDAF